MPVPGDVNCVVSDVSVTQIGIVINGTKEASMLRNLDSGDATISGLEGVIRDAGAVPVGGDVFGSVSAISVLKDAIGDSSGWSMMGNTLNASAVAIIWIELCCVKGMSELGHANGANGVSLLGDMFWRCE